MGMKEEIAAIEAMMREYHQRIKKSQQDLEDRKNDALKEIGEIDAILPQRLTLHFMGDFENEMKALKEIKDLKGRRAKVQELLTVDYPAIQKGLERKSRERVPGQAHLPGLRSRYQEFSASLREFKESDRPTTFEKERLLRLAEEVGELDQVKADLGIS
jgi:hypothetical protein